MRDESYSVYAEVGFVKVLAGLLDEMRKQRMRLDVDIRVSFAKWQTIHDAWFRAGNWM